MEDLSAVLLGPATLTREQLDPLVELEEPVRQRLWQAMGFAEVEEGVPAFTERDVQALRDASAMLATGLVDEELLVTVARSLAQALARLAEMHVQLFAAATPKMTDVPATAAGSAQVMGRLLEYVWRRHVSAAGLGLGVGPERAPGLPGAAEAAVAFVDLVGYTAMSRQLEPAELEHALERFESAVAAVAAERGVRVVKSLGDGALLAAAHPAPLAAATLELLELFEQDPALPGAHAGLASGEVLSRHGDVYGEPVNLASRLTGLARPGSLLCEGRAAELLDADARFTTKAAGRRAVRGYPHLRTWRVRAAQASPSVTTNGT